MSLSQEQQERLIGNILAAPGNELCADCGASEPTWASVNNSVLVCFHCAGVHRSFGTRVSAIKSGVSMLESLQCHSLLQL